MNNKRLDLLFHDNAENIREFIVNTFVNREKEVKIGLSYLYPENPSNKIYAIHGFSRIGKSHLAMYIAEKFVEAHNLIYFYINANTRSTALDILKNLYEKVRIFIATLTKKEIEDKEKQKHLTFLVEYVNTINKLLFMPVEKVSFKEVEELSRELSPRFTAKIPFVDIGVELGGKKSTKKSKENIIELRLSDVNDIRAALTLMVDMIAFITGDNILILLDDLDLLEENEGGKEERDVLTTQLKFIADIQGVAVMVTCRSSYFNQRIKEMNEFIDVPFMEHDDLKRIYDARIRTFHNNEPVFENNVLDELVQGFKGIIGAFLKECDLLLRYSVGETLPLNRDHLRKHLLAVIKQFKENPEAVRTMNLIENAVKDNKNIVEITDMDKAHGFIYRIVVPLGYKENYYEILPLYINSLIEKE